MSSIKYNPHIAAAHFHFRFKTFLEDVIKPKFGVIEYWFRYEWQARGIHLLLGHQGPSWNPDLHGAGQQHNNDPLIRLIRQPTLQDLADVVNWVQRHRCTPAYCLRRRRLHDDPILTQDTNPKFLVYDGSRNDAWLNNYNRTLILSWLTNIGTSPYTSVHAVINYIAKYRSKSEKKTERFNQIAKAILPRVNSSRGLASFVAKFMNGLLSERDWSAQEIHHLLLNLDLQEGTRIVRSVDCRHPDQHWKADFVPVDDETTNVRTAKNTYQ
ncbi:hypothetical protein FSARC_14163 [Fusarium sarcochroum]|uniref:Helitron helicase-like domain-containing protein n=1 Tax=Fusarium sarcochroum TaxID=1208366 RepID=A0A8H4SVR8_9HYPO|nr:hypothetical protein FSARC_14163 [Fusarium sarcochroum]